MLKWWKKPPPPTPPVTRRNRESGVDCFRYRRPLICHPFTTHPPLTHTHPHSVDLKTFQFNFVALFTQLSNRLSSCLVPTKRRNFSFSPQQSLAVSVTPNQVIYYPPPPDCLSSSPSPVFLSGGPFSSFLCG